TAVIASGVQSQTIDWSAPNITITTAAQLKEFAAISINGGNNFEGKTIKLGNSIDLNGNADNQWTPICGREEAFMERLVSGDEDAMLELANKYGYDNIDDFTAFLQNLADEYEREIEEIFTYLLNFQGTFDGAGFTISGVHIVDSENNSRWHYGMVGLFGGIGVFGTVKNLGVTDSYIEGRRAGGLVSTNIGTVENCYATGNVKSVSIRAGGLVTYNEGTIKNCYATGNVEGSDIGDIGGLVAVSHGTIENCYATGNVNEGGEYSFSGGGLVGHNGPDGTITNCYATGNVKGNDAGGLVGNNYGTITNGYAIGNIVGIISDFNNRVGGLVGGNDGNYNDGYVEGIITSSYYDSETSGQSDDDGKGEPKTTAEMKQQSTYTGWDFENIWAIAPAKNNGYPYLGVIEKQKTAIAKKATKKTAASIGFAGIKNGQINLNLNAGTYTAQLYNLQGRLIKSVNINATNGINATNLRTDNLSKGIFILNVKQAGVSVLKRKIAVK
ncbi:MAG: T9SS type A sorting domain-containing protein, partial [Chitinivibrionia bacterium]|nr:T9SS type A sorting domain-containing protein [Chitinivibrionia bacterium]